MPYTGAFSPDTTPLLSGALAGQRFLWPSAAFGPRLPGAGSPVPCRDSGR
ncbi:MAG: hypothetical protein ACLT9P_06970 [Evtepia gabavorous]